MASLAEMMDLEGRRAMVTGGAGHLGRVCAEGLIELGATVALIDIDPRRNAEAVAPLDRMRPGAAMALTCDLRDEASLRATVRRVVDDFGGLDILVHCAALVGSDNLDGWAVPFPEQSVSAFEAAFRIGVTSAFATVQEARSALVASGAGTVVLFSSIYGHVGPDASLYATTSMENPVGYGVSKGGIGQLTRYLATILAPQVRVNAISPGGIARGQPKAFQERYVARVPLGRMAEDQDVKGAVIFLATDLSAYVTGHDLVVDGGWTAW